VNKINKAFLFYPPGDLYQRGEDRSQGNVSNSSATSMRAPNDMGYVSAQLKRRNIEIFFKDYPSEKKSYEDLESDYVDFLPDIVCISTTTSTVEKDLQIINRLKEKNNKPLFVIKGSLFFSAPIDLLKSLDLKNINYLIGGEIEFAFDHLVENINKNKNDLSEIPGIFYKVSGEWTSTKFGAWNKDIDNLPFPDRSVINNKLYVRPDTEEPQATIATSRGCPAACIYCLTPTISGKATRFRDPKKVLSELEDCYYNHGIKNFFFKSDTFTINSHWVLEVCNAIKNSGLKNKIEWVANSRVKPLEQETLYAMREAGCWLVAFGFESGSDETLKKIKKGADSKDNILAAEMTKKADLKLYGFYLIGLPWENENHLKVTRKHIFDTNPDFLELHIAVPYYGTELYDIAKEEGILDVPIVGQNYFEEATTGTKFLSSDYLIKFRKKTLIDYHMRINFISNKIGEAIINPKKLKNYIKYGYRLLRNNIV
jgi:anaerobic magnesium-protoporphyrin IX monomethyl ester cyclase